MLKITNANGSFFIRPTPLVSINHTPIRNKMGVLGCTYSISLNGTIIAHKGSPFFVAADRNSNDVNVGVYNTYNGDDESYRTKTGELLQSIVKKQNTIRKLFSQDGQRIEIFSLLNPSESIVFYPDVVSVEFEEGLYIDTCKYSINLEAPLLFNQNDEVFTEGLVGSTFSPNKYDLNRSKIDYFEETNNITTRPLQDIINRWGGIIEDFSDSWSIEADENNAQSIDSSTIIPLSYVVTRNINVTGRTINTNNNVRYEAWQQALGFAKKTLLEEPSASRGGAGYSIGDNEKYQQYPGRRITDNFQNGTYASDFINLPSIYKGFNHVRTINIDKAGGSCSITDTWLLASGDSHLENYTISTSQSLENSYQNVKIDGTITGLSAIHASGYETRIFNQNDDTPYQKALTKYNDISDDGNFSFGSIVYQRARNASTNNLNFQPLSVSLATNELEGQITYSIEFDDRPYNYFTKVLSENINVNDTNPGDVFAIIPVIGRKTGPILQYIKARTEYRRDLNIELILPHGSIKPSINTTNREELEDLILELSPSGELYVTNYYLTPPTETWSPLEGRYTLSLSWEYEKRI